MRLNIGICHAFLAALCIILPIRINANYKSKQKLLPKLFSGYKSLLAPQENASEPVNVKIGLTLKRMMQLDQKNKMMSSVIFLKTSWIDTRLSWDMEEYPDVDYISVPNKKVWTPDISLYNMVDTMTPLQEVRVVIRPDGMVLNVVPYAVKTTCDVEELDREATCTWTFGSWTQDTRVLDCNHSMDYIDASVFTQNNKWELLKSEVTRQELPFGGLVYSNVQFSLNMIKRRGVDEVEDRLSTNYKSKQKLLPRLFSGYQSSLAPQENATEPVKVDMALTLKRVTRLDQKNQLMSSVIWLQTSWIDTRLSWDMEEYPDVDYISVANKNVWTPDISLFEVVDTMTPLQELPVVLKSDGKVVKVVPYTVKTSCDVEELDREATCTWTFGSWTQDTRLLDCDHSKDRIDASEATENHRWELGKSGVKRQEIKFGDLFYSNVEFSLAMSKRTGVDEVEEKEDSGAASVQARLLLVPLAVILLSRTL